MGINVLIPSVSSTINVEHLLQSFKLRVAADSGVYSAEACQLSTLNALNV